MHALNTQQSHGYYTRSCKYTKNSTSQKNPDIFTSPKMLIEGYQPNGGIFKNLVGNIFPYAAVMQSSGSSALKSDKNASCVTFKNKV